MKTTITRKVLFLLVLAAFGATSAFASFYWFLDRTASETHFVNIAGRQRLLVREMMWYSHAILILNQWDNKRALQATVSEFDRSLDVMEHGGRIRGEFLPPAPAAIRVETNAVRELWGRVKTSLDVIGDQSPSDPTELSYYDLQSNLQLLGRLSDEIVSSFENRSSVLRNQVFYTLAGLAGFNIVLVMVGFLLTKYYLVRPVLQVVEATKHVRSENFTYRIPIFTNDELAVLARAFNEMSADIAKLLATVDAERKFSTKIISNMPSGLAVLSTDLQIILANKAFLELVGCELHQVKDRHLQQILPLESLEELVLQATAGNIARDHTFLEFKQHGRDGARFIHVTITQISITTVPNHQDQKHFLLIVEDLSEIKALRNRVRDIEQRFHQLAEAAADGIILTNADGRIIYSNRAVEALTGYRSKELAGKSMDTLLPAAVCMGPWETPLCHKHGHSVTVQGTTSKFNDDSGFLYSYVFRDVTERKRLESRLKHLADHDPLTGLLNRRRFYSELSYRLANRLQSAALLFIDLDNFKYVNDSLGHQVGDELLRKLAGRIRRRLRKTDLIARLGGDEFALLLSPADADQAQTVAGVLLKEIRAQLVPSGQQSAGTTASIGIALFPQHGRTAEELVSNADIAMYRAKKSGRNRYGLYSQRQRTRIDSRIAWEGRIRRALDNNLFVLYAQPILNIDQDQISHYEVLLRMLDEEGGPLIRPKTFMDAAERSNLIYELDHWVVKQAIHTIAEHRQYGHSLCLEVNLSGKTFTHSKVKS